MYHLKYQQYFIYCYILFLNITTTYFNINSIPVSVLSSGSSLIVTAGVPSEVETIFHILLYTVFKHNYYAFQY